MLRFERVAEFATVIRSQLVVAALLFGAWLASFLGLLPSADQLPRRLIQLFELHGLPILGAASFFEGIVGVNVWIPGSVVVLTGMSLSAGDPMRALASFATILSCSLLAHHVNYLIGRSLPGAATDGSKQKETSWAVLSFALWHPHFAALVALQAGTDGQSYSKFIGRFLLVFAFWNIFWGLTAYLAGQMLSTNSAMFLPFFVAFLLGWTAWTMFRHYRGNASIVQRRD